MFEKKDLIHVQNLAKLLNKSKMELEGQEILAAGEVFRWVGMLAQKIQEYLQHQETQTKLLEGKEKIIAPESANLSQSLPKESKKKTIPKE